MGAATAAEDVVFAIDEETQRVVDTLTDTLTGALRQKPDWADSLPVQLKAALHENLQKQLPELVRKEVQEALAGSVTRAELDGAFKLFREQIEALAANDLAKLVTAGEVRQHQTATITALGAVQTRLETQLSNAVDQGATSIASLERLQLAHTQLNEDLASMRTLLQSVATVQDRLATQIGQTQQALNNLNERMNTAAREQQALTLHIRRPWYRRLFG